ncbi:MAG: SUMF1/EgtB/PvdO family nonheme iron enzyme, partial [Acidobacterium ailaaui]|nr:SUMF1/EgtB/PvdO family nonheme iron enzyme [Pseudacidobacterium ailaaui]
PTYYEKLSGKIAIDPQGPSHPPAGMMPMKVLRGGSFMCSPSYCKGYRVSSRMMSSEDSGLENVGFRCVSSN